MKVRLVGMEDVKAWINSIVPKGMKKSAMYAGAKYLIGNDSHGLRSEPEYKYVTPFKSYSNDPAKAARQRGWIFTHLDQIGSNNRTGAIKNAWDFTDMGDWSRVQIINQTPDVQYVMGEARTKQNKAVGWRKATDVVQSNLAGMIQAMQRAVNELIARKGK